ncbi:MAG: BACON domain-containing protein [Bacteroidales bacterium]|nr:BACON domain-containing protein [Bacteroidales bacterium]
MKILKSLSVFFLIILTAATCQKPQISNTITIVSSQKTNIDAGAQNITLEFATDCKTFQVSIDSKWVQIQEAVGLKYTFSVDENTAEARVAKITASGNNAESLVVSISQAAAGQP